MIWADRTALGVFGLIAVILGMIFIASDAPQRQAELNAKAAKFKTACGPEFASGKALPAAEPEGAPILPKSESPASETPPPQDASRLGEGTLPAPEAEQKTGAPQISERLPVQICKDLEASGAFEAADVQAPTVRELGVNIGKFAVFLVLPLWVALRVVDRQTGGPKRRLARHQFWQGRARPHRSRSRRGSRR